MVQSIRILAAQLVPCCMCGFGKDILCRNVHEGFTESPHSAQLCELVGIAHTMGHPESWVSVSAFSKADLSKAFPFSVSQVAQMGGGFPKILSFLQVLRFWDSLDFALNPIFMTLVSPETLSEEQGPAVGGVDEKHQVRPRAHGAA